MAKINLPDFRDAESIAADYFDALISEACPITERSRIIEKCVPPLVLIIEASRMVSEGDEIGLRIFSEFIRDLTRQVCSHNPT